MKNQLFNTLLYWMHERQCIYNRRATGEPFPWTKDPILQRYRFCNVYRELDRVTVWIRENWRSPYKDHSNLWFAMCVARVINWPPTLEEIGFPTTWRPDEVLRRLRARKARSEKVYTSAYMLPSYTTLGSEQDKPHYTVRRILNKVWKKAEKQPPPWSVPGCTLEQATAWLQQFSGLGGGFLAYEIVTDLRHTRYLQAAPDIYTWANPGSGARRGLNRLHNRPVRGVGSRVPKKQLLEEMQWVYKQVCESRDAKILPQLEMRDIEHSLCELDKYLRAKERERTGLELFQMGLFREGI